jgi:hypothetical protein
MALLGKVSAGTVRWVASRAERGRPSVRRADWAFKGGNEDRRAREEIRNYSVGCLACTPIYPRSCVASRVAVVPRAGRCSKVIGRGAASLVRRLVPLPLRKFAWRERTETRMRPGVIIILPPVLDDLPRFGQTVEQVFVPALVAQAAVEAPDEGVLDWLARFDVMPSHPTWDPTQDSYTSKFAAIITDYYFRPRALVSEAREFLHHAHAAKRRIGGTGQAFAAEVIHDA